MQKLCWAAIRGAWKALSAFLRRLGLQFHLLGSTACPAWSRSSYGQQPSDTFEQLRCCSGGTAPLLHCLLLPMLMLLMFK